MEQIEQPNDGRRGSSPDVVPPRRGVRVRRTTRRGWGADGVGVRHGCGGFGWVCRRGRRGEDGFWWLGKSARARVWNCTTVGRRSRFVDGWDWCGENGNVTIYDLLDAPAAPMYKTKRQKTYLFGTAERNRALVQPNEIESKREFSEIFLENLSSSFIHVPGFV